MKNFRLLVGISAVLVAGCAAFFSVTGLGLLFDSYSVMVMAGCLEFAKLVTASYLKQKWQEFSKLLKTYLVISVIILMIITSLGIYGFLTDAFNKQRLMIEQAERQVQSIENKISINKSEINRYQSQINSAIEIRNSQEKNLSTLINAEKGTSRVSRMISNADNQINLVSRKIDSLNNSNVLLYSRLDSVKTNNAGIEREVGGFLFVAKTFNIPLNKAVNWFIMLIVFVFDPLAIALLLAFNQQQKLLPVEVPIEHYEAKRGRPKKKL
jgi:hypothetical protein